MLQAYTALVKLLVQRLLLILNLLRHSSLALAPFGEHRVDELLLGDLVGVCIAAWALRLGRAGLLLDLLLVSAIFGLVPNHLRMIRVRLTMLKFELITHNLI